ncbi:hypothetical protein HYT84_02535, partial [Candidatus Micrarchaeota archaeon]|nr:hypothetical protein [Candidatus Micrarchaeota archaeon]
MEKLINQLKLPKFQIILLTALFLFLAGCAIQKSDNFSCCLQDQAKKGQCLFLNNQGPQDKNTNPISYSTLYCNMTNMSCGVKFDLNLQSQDSTLPQAIKDFLPKKEKEIAVPICTERAEVTCYDANCTAMACAKFKYNPTSKLDAFPTIESDEEANDFAKSLQDDSQPGLVNRSCRFVPFNKQLGNAFENDKGGFINIFRLGIGPTYEDYNRARYIFPISDLFCNINDLGTKDRFQNYLPTIDYYLKNLVKTEPTHPFDPVKDFDDLAYCVPSDDKKLELPLHTEQYSGDSGSYKLLKNQRIVDLKIPNEAYTGGIQTKYDIQGFTNYTELDREFYVRALQFFYWNDIVNTKTGGKAPFECTSGAECKSGSCSMDYYRRGTCQTKNGEFVNCQCVVDFSKDYKSDYYKSKNDYKQIGICDATTVPAKPSIAFVEGSDLYDTIMSTDGFITQPLKINICEYSNYTHLYVGKDKKDASNKYSIDLLACGSDCSNFKILKEETKGGLFGDKSYYITVNYINKSCADYTSDPSSSAQLDKPDITDPNADFTSKILFPNKDLDFLTELYKNFTKKDPKKPFIGFAILDLPQFAKSALASTCNMKSGVNYETLKVEQLLSPVSFETLYNINYQHGYSGNKHSFIYHPCEEKDIDGDGNPDPYPQKCSKENLATAPKFITFVYDLGDCDLNSQDKLPVTKDLGWCEACTYATMAYQNVSVSESYDYIKYKPETSGSKAICYNWPNCKQGDYVGAYAYTAEQQKNYPLPSTYPEITYLQTRTTQYLENGVLPILEVSSDDLWTEVKDKTKLVESCDGIELPILGCIGKKTKKSVTVPVVKYDPQTSKVTFLEGEPHDIKYLFEFNKGPIVAIIGRLQPNELDTPTNIKKVQDEMVKRAAIIKHYCSKCLVSVVPESGAGYGKSFTTYKNIPNPEYKRQVSDISILNKLFGIISDPTFDLYVEGQPAASPDYLKTVTCSVTGTCNKNLLNLIDIIGFKYYPSEVTDGYYWYLCDESFYGEYGEPDYRVFPNLMIDFGYTVLKKYNKPSLVVEFIDLSPDLSKFPSDISYENICDSGNADLVSKHRKKMYDQIFLKREELSRAGVIGIVFQKDFVKTDYYLKGGQGEKDDYTLQFPNLCPFEQSSHLLTADVPLFFYNK